MKILDIPLGEQASFRPNPSALQSAAEQWEAHVLRRLVEAGFRFVLGPDMKPVPDPPLYRFDNPRGGIEYRQEGPIDYRDLLKRFIAHAGDESGRSCMPDANDGELHGRRSIPFTSEEVDALDRLNAEGFEEYDLLGAPRPRIVMRLTVPPEESRPPTPDQIWENVDPAAGLKR